MKNDVKVAVVGAGYWGKNSVGNFGALGVLAAICDTRKEALEGFSKKNPDSPALPIPTNPCWRIPRSRPLPSQVLRKCTTTW